MRQHFLSIILESRAIDSLYEMMEELAKQTIMIIFSIQRARECVSDKKKTKTKFGTEIVRICTQLIRKSFTLKQPIVLFGFIAHLSL